MGLYMVWDNTRQVRDHTILATAAQPTATSAITTTTKPTATIAATP